jgi:serine phosphatase RsbU (regulator of sigma subunit)
VTIGADGAAPAGLLVLDATGRVRYVDPPVAALLGAAEAELDGVPLAQLLTGPAATALGDVLAESLATGHPGTWSGLLGAVALTVHTATIGDRLHVTVRPGGPDVAHDDAERLRFLAEVSEVMNGTLDADEAAGSLARLVVPRLCDWVVVTVVDDDGRRDHAVAHRDPDRLPDVRTYLGRRAWGAGDEQSPLVSTLLSGEPLQLAPIDNALAEAMLGSDEARAAWRRLDVGSCTLVPLKTRRGVIGAVSLMNGARRPAHTPAEVDAAVEVARRAALALDNARLYGRQLEVAETLQRSLLSAPPRLDGLDVAVRYLPAAAHLHVGGDWYDAFRAPDGATLLVLGDVVGHNVDAAAAMGQLRSLVRGIAWDRPGTPAGILTRVDDVLTGLSIGALATALVARLEPPGTEDGGWTLRWSSAGHLPPLLARDDGSVRTLATPPEILLGAASTRPRTDHEAVLRPGDTLVLCTDGLVEHDRTDIDTGLARLAGVLAGGLGRSVEEVCDLLLEEVVGTRPDDDVALIVVRLR